MAVTNKQILVFSVLYLSYAGIYICRRNYGNLVSSFTASPPANCLSPSCDSLQCCQDISSQCVWQQPATGDATESSKCVMPSEWESMYVSSSERLTLEEVGRLGTSFQLFAIASKLLTGVFVDTHSPGLVLSGAILLCALINITMAFVTHNLLALTMLWGLNGFVSAVAWPALSRSFMQWFPDPK